MNALPSAELDFELAAWNAFGDCDQGANGEVIPSR